MEAAFETLCIERRSICTNSGPSTHHRLRGEAGSADLRPGGEDRRGARAGAEDGLGQVCGRKQGASGARAAAGEGALVRLQGSRRGGNENGSATFRPNEPVRKMAKRMEDREATAVLVTTSDGRLVGLLYREDAEHLAGVQT